MSATSRNTGMLQKPTTTPTRVGSFTSRTHGHTRMSPLEAKPSRKNTAASHEIGGASAATPSGGQHPAQTPLNARNGGRRPPRQPRPLSPPPGAPPPPPPTA